MTLTLQRLREAVEKDAAFRRIQRMQAAGGAGDKLFPPTYPAGKNEPPRHVFERRRFNGENVLCVLLDSVQSQANRLEEALREFRDLGHICFPVISVDFTGSEAAKAAGVDDIGSVSTLDAPHRVFDAIIRDSELAGVRFRDTEPGKQLVQAKAQNARAVYELSPSALVFGAWNSTGEGGGLGAKFPRCLVSEIIGVNVATDPTTDGLGRPSGQRTGSRIDPLGIRSAVKVFKRTDGEWSIEKSSGGKEVKPSEINHSNIKPSVTPLGVSIDYALHSFVLSFPALRRLKLGGASPAADVAARTALAALGVCAAVAQDARGYALRSRCDLIPDGAGTFEFVGTNGTTESVPVELPEALELFRKAAAAAASAGAGWRTKDLVLTPQAKLVALVKESRAKALQGEEDPDAGQS